MVALAALALRDAGCEHPRPPLLASLAGSATHGRDVLTFSRHFWP
jgi:hypothetical protein